MTKKNTKTAKGNKSSPTHRPTKERRETVEAMSAAGIKQADIAVCLDINRNTLLKHYRNELDQATAKANSSIAGRLYQKAMNGDTTAMIFWLKTRGKWSEKIQVENTGVVATVPIKSKITDPMEGARLYKELIKGL